MMHMHSMCQVTIKHQRDVSINTRVNEHSVSSPPRRSLPCAMKRERMIDGI